MFAVSIFLLGYYAEGMHTNLIENVNLNIANDGASVTAILFHALIVFGKNDCPYG